MLLYSIFLKNEITLDISIKIKQIWL